MADKTLRVDKNAPGPWFVDANCIACGLCIDLSDANMELDFGIGYAFVKRQPATPDEEAALNDAADQCPVESIGREE